MAAFLALRVLYVVALVYFAFVFRFFYPESLPGDDVICRLPPRPLPSVCFLPCLFVLLCFVFSDRVRPRFVWCNLVFFVFHLSSSCDIGEPGMGSAPLLFLDS